ncbi:lipocalin-like domain-containing protein [Halomonas sp. HP20-15]|uniref:lipocalin-like domain-containing protein n=1 Tax=Halomonas sp. HP20-15 TaxID=3085901 RepID=UPI0029825158|nr:lipocalin-like domain-containing protein [Halomonas sp. HP20-15]MDW5378608.1 lipocalin-like domain-containing protein [Halomonas sp. HP20-15]
MTKRQWTLFMAFLAVVLIALVAAWRPWATPAASTSAGYAGLGDEAAGFAEARPGGSLAFPADHGAHPDFRIEWWYLTANLESADGRPFGVQWTLFRQALAPPGVLDTSGDDSPWKSRQLWMAHAALSTPRQHYDAERFARGMALKDLRGQAGVEAAPFAAWLDDWTLAAPGPMPNGTAEAAASAGDALDRLRVRAAGENFAYDLALDAQGPLVMHGDAGFSQKSADGQGSIYYSQPFYRVSGKLKVDGEPIMVSGRAWLDREWSSQLLGPGQRGWDWFSLHLEGGAKLMAFRLRGAGEAGGDYLSGSWIAADGRATPLDEESLQLTPQATSEVAGRQLPTVWRLAVPGHGVDVTVRAVHPDQWMDTSFAYWEGMVSVEGSHGGEGYLEMTGYR